MKARHSLLKHAGISMLFAALTFGLAGCSEKWSWHQKLTVSVETPDGLKAGGAVSEVNVSLLPENVGLGDFRGSGSSSLTGEAVVVDLGSGHYLFALLKGYGQETAVHTFADAGFVPQPKRREALEKAYDVFEKLQATTTLPSDRYPLLVTFVDINDPASVKRVDPEDLAATFGPGYHLNSITMTLTDEPVTKGKLESVLGWWNRYENKQLDGNRYTDLRATNRFANSLNRLDFQRGF